MDEAAWFATEARPMNSIIWWALSLCLDSSARAPANRDTELIGFELKLVWHAVSTCSVTVNSGKTLVV